MELEMTIDDPTIIIGTSKIEDITKLVQLYMVTPPLLRSESRSSKAPSTRSTISSGRNSRT